ncbi:MAG: Flp pilus assembly complex ATPase component TadA [Phycisphaerales bacterium]|nr:Flp pilus assembly complex ATPase component TadA [Phycisphaerae bacterium]NNF41624.1 Flp pilus assembly complex ATPase component TadA [Phycisphaerales bacterium]NNM24574.1 Flp pilus assembly complex ATPase component TadA [Phycisphaerales bacterium]
MTNEPRESGAVNTATRRGVPQLGALVIERGLITPEQLEHALTYQREKRPTRLLGQVLLELGVVTPEDLVSTLADAANVPFLKITPPMVDLDAFALLPRKFIDKNNALPVSLSEERLTVALEDFTNVFLVEDIERLAGHTVHLVAATRRNIREVLASLSRSHEEFAFDQIIEDMTNDDLTVLDQGSEDFDDLEHAASDSPVIKLVNHIVQGAIHEGASDIHIEPDQGRCRVRYRIDGDLVERLEPPIGFLPAVVSRIKIMATLDIAERRVPQDGSITVALDDRPIDLRVSTMPTKFGEKVVIRVIDHKGTVLDLARLGFRGEMLGPLREAITEPNGVVLVTGPTGSGKSTTLYACLSEIASTKLNVSTIEDPVEYNLFGINQSQVNDKAGFTFARALRALLRQDPDVIMVGEIRDAETARIAVQAALTGHLVLSTLHTNDAPSAITRLVNMQVEPYLVAASLRAVVAQRLVRHICSFCQEPATLDEVADGALRRMFGGTLPAETFFRGAGCGRCRGTGSLGRVGIYELLVPDPELLEAISQGAPLQELRRRARTAGCVTLREDGLAKVREGVIGVDAFLSIVARRDEAGAPSAAEDVWHVPSRQSD